MGSAISESREPPRNRNDRYPEISRPGVLKLLNIYLFLIYMFFLFRMDTGITLFTGKNHGSLKVL